MTENVRAFLNALKSGEYKKHRANLGDAFVKYSDSEHLRMVFDAEIPVLYDNDIIGFNRSADYVLNGKNGNITPNYIKAIRSGFDALIGEIEESIAKTDDPERIAYGKEMADSLKACFIISDKYREYAKDTGNGKLYNALLKIPHKGAESFYEACVFLKFIIFCIRCAGFVHLGIGRFDQYMYPYYVSDRKNGVTDDEIFETVERFFISINFDTDLYFSVQQGDNGQSMMLGGFDKTGKGVYNELSEMCMKASLELCVIDPKINLRVGKNTPVELYELGTLLTKQGLGFPQYCNDDVVVPGLLKLGYELDDAIDYTVAACWEYIIPNCGGDYPNLEVMDFPKVVNDVVLQKLSECDTYGELEAFIKEAIKSKCEILRKSHENKSELPLISAFVDGCIEKLKDLWSGGAKYNNYGCHGVGIATAADSLSAIKKHVFDDHTITKEELLDALKNSFENNTKLRNMLLESPKMGNNDDYVDSIACMLMDTFANNMNNFPNCKGGIWRAGTGSAMEYLWRGTKCPATADGRMAYAPYSANFSPSIEAKTNGILSVIRSFTKYDLTNIINGGPLTIEIHDTVLRNDIGIKKTAMLVKEFIDMGGHQLQLNSVNKERLLDAQKHPENYPNLIVRVWGWSGYFTELDISYQNHIISRCEYLA